jgi:molecular chaperone DnaK (HSP70)
MPARFAIDFGTTNTVVAMEHEGTVQVVPLPAVTRERAGTPVIPSAVCFGETGGPPLIGQPAVDQNALGRLPGFAQGFKRHLGRSSHRTVARAGGMEIPAGRAAEAYFHGLREALRDRLRPGRRPIQR